MARPLAFSTSAWRQGMEASPKLTRLRRQRSTRLFSSTESSCYTACMDKYMAAWNTVSRQYLSHVQKGPPKF